MLNVLRLCWNTTVLRLLVSNSFYLTLIHLLMYLFYAHECMLYIHIRLDVQYKSVDELYTKPYTRLAQYITGVWAGYYLSKVNRQWRVRKVSVMKELCFFSCVMWLHIFFFYCCFPLQTCINLGWALSIFTLLFLVFIQIYKETNFFVSFVFPAVGRILWSLPICFIIFAGSTQFNEGEDTQYY
jgi:hypothetical protein